MKIIIIILQLSVANLIMAQDYLESKNENIIDVKFPKEGHPKLNNITFTNFNKGKNDFELIEGLRNKNHISTTADTSKIEIRYKNIGRLVLYTTLYDTENPNFYNLSSKSLGKITITPYRNGKLLVSEIYTTIFDQDLYQQIHINYHRKGINKLEIKFERSGNNNIFLIDKIKVRPLTNIGINYYSQLEEFIESIIKSSENNFIGKIRDNYISQLSQIQKPYKYLSEMITGEKIKTLAAKQVESVNPVMNDTFVAFYKDLLKNTRTPEKGKFETLIDKMRNNKLKDVALTLGSIFTGGNLSELVSLANNLFKNPIKIGTSNIVKINNSFFQQSNGRFNSKKVILKTIKNDRTIKKLTTINQQNDAFKEYLKIVIELIKQDSKAQNQLNMTLSDAKKLKGNIELQTFGLIESFTKLDKENFINESSIDFVNISTEISNQFEQSTISSNNIIKLKEESILNFYKFNHTLSSYNKIMSKIKSQFDIIYEINPKRRMNIFKNISNLPMKIKEDWIINQQAIIDDYTRKDGMKAYLMSASKNNN